MRSTTTMALAAAVAGVLAAGTASAQQGPAPKPEFKFEKCYGNDPNGRAARRKPSDSKEDRWRSFAIAEVKERDFKLDSFKWLKEESLEDADDLPEPCPPVVAVVAQQRGE